MKLAKPRLRNKINRDELRQKMADSTESRTTLSFYKYHQIASPVAFRNSFFEQMNALGVLGRIYVAHEGINAQISVPTAGFDAFKTALFSHDFLKNVRLNLAREDDGRSFFVLKVRVREKIVADGLDDPGFDASNSGQHLSAAEFNDLAARPETIVVDMRNHYESEVGHFENAILPPVETFREALPLVVDLLSAQKKLPVVMYCTGGIRCEKASAWLRHQGFENVFQLDGGIIEYDRQAREQGLENRFLGKNFVFDERRAERIGPEIVSNCHQCGQPADTHANCKNDFCNLLFIQCEACAARLENCCSGTCRDFIHLPDDEQKRLGDAIDFHGKVAGRIGNHKSWRQGKPLA